MPLHVVEETKEAKAAVLCARLLGELCSRMTIMLPDIGVIYSLLTAKCIHLSLLIDHNTYFKEVIQYYYSQFSPVFASKWFLTIEISQIDLFQVSASS